MDRLHSIEPPGASGTVSASNGATRELTTLISHVVSVLRRGEFSIEVEFRIEDQFMILDNMWFYHKRCR
jgi:hypothetical protein